MRHLAVLPRGRCIAVTLVFAFAALVAAISADPARAALPASDAVRAQFAHPPVEDTTGVLWVWNDLLTEAEIRDGLRELAAQGIKQPFVHPRPGLMTPYLSAEWFRLWKIAVDEAKALGLKLWIYDENSYPSGFAGGFVPEAMPESRGLGLALTESKTPPRWDENSIAVHRMQAGGPLQNLSAGAKAGEALPAGDYVHATLRHAAKAPWYGDRFYVNLLTPGVTQKFLELTHEAYRREVGAEFGQTVPGIFTDEPQVRPAGGWPWCADLPERFAAKWGYSLVDSLPSLGYDVGDWRRVRHNYFALLNELMVERWAKPYHDYCAAHQLEATGHYWEHEWPGTVAVPDNMTMYAWQHRPGIDTLMNDYAEGPNAQFGNARAVREIASVARQLGRPRTLCEAYGAAGWDLRFADMKRIGDWLQVLGANTLVEHLSYVTIRGGRKRDHPQSFSYHEPWWPAYHLSADYQARVTVAVTHGDQQNDVLLLEPTSTAWMYNLGRHSAATLKSLGEQFQGTVNAFEAAQVEYDIGSEYVLGQHGSVHDGKLVVGKAAYAIVVVPDGTENLDHRTVELLEEFLRAKGTVIGCDPAPRRVDGAEDPRPEALAHHPGWKRMETPDAVRWLGHRDDTSFAIHRVADDKGVLFHQRRRLADGELVFLVNTSAEHPCRGTVVTGHARRAEQWDPATGAITEYPCASHPDRLTAEFSLPPTGSLLLFFAQRAGAAAPPPRVAAAETIPPLGSIEIRRTAPNVMTLDFVDVSAGGETRKDQYFWAAAQFAFKQNGLPQNPWEQAVQFKDEGLKREFPKNGGFEAAYRFRIEERVPANLAIVLERPDLYTVTCNGRAVAASAGAWWLDKAFGVIDLAGVARVGENVVSIHAAALTNFHELEPAYLRGDFRLRAAPDGFIVAPDAPLALGQWNAQGHPFYAEGVAYRQRFNVAAVDGRFVVSLPNWYGSVARVTVNGADAGGIGWPPWQCDVTPHVRVGENTVEVVVVGTLKNTLGPHHGNPPLGRAWPAAFRVGPKKGRAAGADYSTIGYGLFEPFVLTRTATAP